MGGATRAGTGSGKVGSGNGKPARTAGPAKPATQRGGAECPPAGISKQIRRAAELFKQVSDPTRLAVLTMLADGPKNVTEICAAVGSTSQPAVSHHLAIGRHAGVIEPTRRGKHNIYSLTDKGRRLVGAVAGVMAEA